MVKQSQEKVPWTIQQTFLGILLTVTPWVALTLIAGLTSTSTPTHPMPDVQRSIVTFISSVIIEGSYVIAPFYFAYVGTRSLRPHWRSAFEALGFRRFPIVKALIQILLFTLIILFANNLFQQVVSYFHLNLQTNDQVILKLAREAPITTYITLFVAVFIAPICEEIFFRGFVFAGFLKEMPVVWAILFSALFFGVAHADFGSFTVLFIIGIFLAYIRYSTNSIWPGIFLHMINNGLSALIIILYMQHIIHV
ncbi:MAG TPA: CPBP family intramembrane glutamic endopeptidase [Ktedonobacteraceae bacterium]|nr:CPBP family intramembrane glutamic endopeptidase [Ktedonobacteraceae bacterium]